MRATRPPILSIDLVGKQNFKVDHCLFAKTTSTPLLFAQKFSHSAPRPCASVCKAGWARTRPRSIAHFRPKIVTWIFAERPSPPGTDGALQRSKRRRWRTTRCMVRRAGSFFGIYIGVDAIGFGVWSHVSHPKNHVAKSRVYIPLFRPASSLGQTINKLGNSILQDKNGTPASSCSCSRLIEDIFKSSDIFKDDLASVAHAIAVA